MTTTGTIDTPSRTIKVERLEGPLKSGNRHGKPWMLFAVHATELDGTPINDELRTFDGNLGVGTDGVVEVDAEAFVKDGTIQHYTLKSKSKRRHGGAGSDSGELESLRKRVEKLERQIGAIIRAEGIDT